MGIDVHSRVDVFIHYSGELCYNVCLKRCPPLRIFYPRFANVTS